MTTGLGRGDSKLAVIGHDKASFEETISGMDIGNAGVDELFRQAFLQRPKGAL